MRSLIFVYTFLLLGSISPATAQNNLNTRLAEQQFRAHCYVCRSPLFLPLQGSMLPFATRYHQAHRLLAQQQYNEALPHVLKAIDQLEKQPDDTLLYLAHLIEWNIYLRGKLPQKGAAALQQAIAIARERRFPLAAEARSDLAVLYFNARQYQQALTCYAAIQRMPGFDTSASLQRTVFNNTALCYLYLEKYQEAETFHQKSLQLETALRDTTGIATSYLNIGDLYYEQYLDKKAIPYWKKSLALAQQQRSLAVQQNASYNLFVAMKNLGNYHAATNYLEAYLQVKDSIWNRDKVWDLAQKEKNTALALKQQELVNMQHRSQLQLAEIKQKRWQRNTFLVAAGSFMALSIISLLAVRQKVRSNRVILSQKTQVETLLQTREKLFSVVAHDLRSPVFSLQLLANENVQLLANRHQPALQENLHTMQAELKQYQHLLDNLMQWVWIQSGRYPFHPEQLPLAAIVQQVAHDLKPALQRKHNQLETLIPPELMIHADINAVKTVLRNVMGNAVKYTNKGIIRISATEENGMAQLRIQDSGIGIPPETRANLFAINEKKQRSGTAGEPSTGLGLWLCHYLLQMNRGSITAPASHTGALILITLPIA
ncbi:sensor histidine kinase [Chitinophaga vietnamensis]|uniref:sensor histidine kinase n=1 Tax=Chitinophaga vietnamensis TaxID=2593957 RepID=UPI001177537E|nr:tetratricopeptide repeat-containing sensor histidine kinase [Chitinophaga vietnamensis]